MYVNIHDLVPRRTSKNWPKVQFKVSFCDKDEDGKLVPKFTSEGWTLYRSRAKPDDRGVRKTLLKLPQVPWIKNGMTVAWLTACQCDEDLFEAIHQFLAGRREVQRWLALEPSNEPVDDNEAPELRRIKGVVSDG